MGIAPFRLGETPALDVLRKAYGAALDTRDAELGVELHSPLKDKEHQRRFSLLIGIRKALAAREQLSLVYQPRIDVKTGSCVSAEALLRWHHPVLGSISPSEFIPLVEQTALDRPVTDFVLETALAQAAAWKSEGFEFGISINVFAANLEEEDFAWRLREALDRHGVSPSMVELEFTEGALIRRRARVLEQLIDIRAVGVTCAIDDFGTGYSSFAYLQNIPADVIKIDRSFMGGLERERDQTLVRVMITMSHELNYRVVAEGVETQEAYEFLAKSGCDEIQGYLISRPLSPSGFGKWLSAKLRSGGEERAA
jgi:EAL domain-containing protein (putative c-di-GMP-specific phosphodiesterase class I)